MRYVNILEKYRENAMNFKALFQQKPIIGCIHLAALPGAPKFNHNFETVIEQAINEAKVYQKNNIDGLIVENFNDVPFYPNHVPHETVAAMAVICHEIKKATNLPLGINVLRNDAKAALSIATVSGAEFIRVNIHLGAVVADQGIIQGIAHELLRYRQFLGNHSLIMADVAVKHAMPIADHGLINDTLNLTKRGMVDGLIVSGSGTGKSTSFEDLQTVKQYSELPVFIGSGIQKDNIQDYLPFADGFIVGSYFKHAGIAQNTVDEIRVKDFCEFYRQTQ